MMCRRQQKMPKKWASKLARDEAVTKFKSITKQADYVKDEMKKCEERFKELGGMQDKIGYVLEELGAKLEGVTLDQRYQKVVTATQTEELEPEQELKRPEQEQQEQQPEGHEEEPKRTVELDLTEDISEQSAVTEAVEGLLDLTGTGLASQSSNVEVMEVESDVDKTRKAIEGANLEDRTKCVLLNKILQPKPPKITHVDMILWEDQMVDVSATFSPLSSIRTPSTQIQIPPAFSPSMFQMPPTASIPGFFQVGSATATATGGQDIVSSAATLAGLIPPTTPSTMVTPSHLCHFQQQQQPMFQ